MKYSALGSGSDFPLVDAISQLFFSSEKCNFDDITRWLWDSGRSLPEEEHEWWVAIENRQKSWSDKVDQGKVDAYWDQEQMLFLLQKSAG